MKKLLLAISLILGAATVHAGGRQGQGWNVTVVTGTHKVVFDGPGIKFVKAIILSSGSTTGIGDYLVGYTTSPSATLNGADSGGLFGGALFSSTAQVITPLVYKTTSTVSGVADSLNNSWTPGDSADSFIEVQNLIIRQSATSTGEANKATVIWSR